MIAAIPGGVTLVSVLMLWLGITASAGEHVRPGRLARLARAAWETRMGWPVHDDLDDDDDPDACLPPPAAGDWAPRLEEAASRWAGSYAEITPDEWHGAMLRKSAPHLYSPDWYKDMRISHIRWATMLWEEIRTMKREAGISE